MGNPSKVESSVQNGSDGGEMTFDQQVSSIVSQMTVDEKGNYQMPDIEMSEPLKFAANAERRRRSTESALSKTRLQLKAKEHVNTKLVDKVSSLIKPKVTEEQLAELEDLKFTDPDEWHRKLSAFEKGATSTLNDEMANISSEASQQAIQEMVDNKMAEYNTQNPDAQITQEVLDNELPPAYMRQLSNGDISFDDFLVKANKFLKTPKKVGGKNATDMPNLGEAGGGATPAASAVQGQAEKTYENTIF